jgi:hypothetical protein
LKYWHRVNEHQHCEDHEMKPSKRFGQSLVVTCEAAEAVEPAKAALDHPPPGQQHKALFRFLQLDHLQFNAFIECGLRWLFARVSLIGKCHLDRMSRYLLDLTRKLCYLRALLLIGRCDMYREQLSQRVHRNMHLTAALALIPS